MKTGTYGGPLNDEFKMQSDSIQLSTSGHIGEVNKPAITQETMVKSFQCCRCTLIFKSKVYLFDHLNKVHGLDVDSALTEAGLKYAGTNKANTDRTDGRSTRNPFKCQNCDFKTYNWFILNQHEKQCEKTENPNVIGTAVLSENTETKIFVFSTKRHNEDGETGETSSKLPVMSTSEAQCTPTLSKDLKTYKRPSQNVTKEFASSSGSDGKPHAKLDDDPKGTLILQENPSSSSSINSGVFKVTAMPMIDMSDRWSHHLLHDNHLLISDLRPPKPKEQVKAAVQNNHGKRTKNQSSQGPPAKKSKSGEVKKHPERENKSKESSNSTDFSFEVSDDEEQKANLGNGGRQRPKVYFCKHCDYTDEDFRRVSSHYQNDHPYVKYKAVYIQSSNDQSATFRCLECPIEFLSTVDLKWHYMEKHPEAPDIFKMKPSEFNLIFKCFECPFTTKTSKALRRHYKVKHPLHQVDSSLLFCRYSVTQCQEESSSLKTQEKMPSLERPGEISPVKASPPCEQIQNTPPPRQPTSKGSDAILHKCNNCEFVHKSVVVMHVHYQKHHPNEAVAIDKIRQLTCSVTDATSQSTPKKESLQEAKDEPESQEKISLSVPEHKPETSKDHSESPQTKKVEYVEVESKEKMSSTKPHKEITSGMDDLSSSLTDDMFFCQFCDYSNPNIRSVVNHCGSKHAMHAPISQEDIARYSGEEHKRRLDSKASKQVKVCSGVETECEENDAGDVSLTEINAYAHAEKLFYCQECNFGNPTIKGVLIHQQHTHKCTDVNRERILEYTALIRDEIEKSKLDAKGSLSSSRLPLPLLNEGDGNMLFCHLCNYRNSGMSQVVRHYYKNHSGFGAKTAHIQQYTSMVMRQMETQPLNTAVNQEVNQESPLKMEKKKTKKLAKFSSDSVPMSTMDSTQQKQRTLQCCKCKYSTQYVFLLRKHMRKTHHSRRSTTDILKICFQQGNLQSGYHCEWCVFSHKEAAAIHKHYQEQHPGHLSSLAYVTTQLYVGPSDQEKKAKLKSTHHADDSMAAQRAGQNESETYSCNTCSFKSCSRSGLASHRQAVHSWSAKEDGWDLLGNKKASAKSEMEDLNNIPGLFESFQVPLWDAEETTSACTLFKCPSCPANFNTRHGLNVHQGIKHLESVNEEEQEKRQVQIQTRVHVFKCPHCPYVNTAYQGVLTHCQKKHPALPTRADSLHVDVTQLHNHDDYLRKKDSGDALKFSGYMCKTCQKICATLDKLNMHCERDHNKTLSGTVSNTLKEPSALHKKIPAKANSAQRFACQHCCISCRTKIGLSHHVRICHKNVFSKDCVYKCALCPQFYFSKKRLGCHYAKRHGKSAYMKYYVPVYKKVLKKLTAPSQDSPPTQQLQNNSTEDRKKLVYKCPNCPYVNTSYHGTLTHCQMKHPMLVIRANELEIGEILVADIVGSSIGRSFNERGYECNKCPQIHVSLKKLKIHCQKAHADKLFCELQADTERENQPVNTSQVPEWKATPLKEKTSEDSITKSIPSLCSLGESLSGPESTESKALYKCQICTYAPTCRRYLQCHYKKTHKLDALSINKLLEKYNKRKYRSLSRSPDSQKIANAKCVECPDLTFDSCQSLIDHYSSSHRLNAKQDFTVVSSGAKYNSTGVYKCTYCATQLNGTRKLCYHLDRHRAKLIEMTEAAKKKPSLLCTTASDPKPISLFKQNEAPTFESVEELAKWNVTSVESITQPSSPQSPSKLSSSEPEVEARKAERHACNQCKKTFMSLKGLRSHERSHAAMAAIKKLDRLPTSELKHNITKYVLHKSGTLKPFLCGCCSYRTNLLGLWRSHFLKNHKDVIQKDNAEIKNVDEITQTADEELFDSQQIYYQFELDEEAEEPEESTYLEPPDVQRQLNHYSLMAQSNNKSKSAQKTPGSRLLHCEICNFKTEHPSSIRRHYLNRHGKKILRCKDCNFFTGLRRTLEMHVETGHHIYQSEPTHQKDLRCPFCLYQTKNKNNMIDHIVLHREERVVPIEVRRPKLSRYLEGIVFRCHKCTFSSGSAENLRLHMLRHNDVRPYKCRLCYFDCSRLSELEAHLSDKHQVLRNYELVGQVSLDQIEMRTDKGAEKDKHNTYSEDVETAKFVPDTDEAPQAKTLTEYDATEKFIPSIKEAQKKQEQDRNEESPTEDSVLDILGGNAKSYSVVKKYEQDLQTQAGNVALPSARGEISVEQKAGEGSSANSQHDTGPNREDWSKAQTKLGDEQYKKAAERRSTYSKVKDTADAHKLHLKTFQQKTLNIEARVEDDILRHMSLMDEDGIMCKMHSRANQEKTVKVDQTIEGKGLDNDSSDNLLLDKEDSISLDQNTNNQVNTNCLSGLTKVNPAQANNTKPQDGFRFERHLLTLSPIYPQLKLSHKDTFGVSFTDYKKEQEKVQKNCEKEPGPDENMPVLENEYLKKELSAPENCKEKEETVHLEHKQDRNEEMITEDRVTQRSDPDSPKVDEGTFEATNGAAEILRSSCTEVKRFTCEFCGRHLMNMSELNYHVMRHGL